MPQEEDESFAASLVPELLPVTAFRLVLESDVSSHMPDPLPSLDHLPWTLCVLLCEIRGCPIVSLFCPLLLLVPHPDLLGPWASRGFLFALSSRG